MEDPNQEKKSRFDLQPHYIEWGLTALGVIVACVLVVFVLFRMTMIWGHNQEVFQHPQPVHLRLCDGVPAHAGVQHAVPQSAAADVA